MSPNRTRAFLAATVAITVAIMLLGALWLLRPTQPALAQSQPDALGSISGIVRNPQGDPLPNIAVALLQYPATFASPLRSVTTDAQGGYHLLSIPPGAYRVRFEDNGDVYATTYYAGASVWDEATLINVSGHEVTSIDQKMTPGGSISVAVTPSLPITNSYLALNLFAKLPSGRWELFDSLFWPVEDKETIFQGLPNGVYSVCGQPYNSAFSGDFSECYDNSAYDLDYGHTSPTSDASEIVISDAKPVTITMQFGDFSQLQGTVRSTTGEPLANVQLNLAYSYDDTSSVAIVTSNAQGKFSFGRIYSGEYYLRAIDNSANYFSTYYPDESFPAQHKRFQIDANARYSVTVTMARSGAIGGKVRVDGGAIPPSLYISPLRPGVDGSWDSYTPCYPPECNSLYDSATGVYTVTGLTTGKYRVQFSDPNNQLGPLSGYYGGASFQDADDIQVTSGKMTTNINVTLGIGGFEGTITGRVTANGAAQSGIEVGLFLYNFEYYGVSSLPFVATTTDDQGKYRFDGLSSGSYFVGFRDPTGGHALNFYDSGVITPTEIIITGKMTAGNIDASLIPGGTIRGTIKRAAGNSPLDFSLILYVADTWRMVPFVDVHPDPNGNFEIKGIPPGRYRVAVTDPDSLTPIHFYPLGDSGPNAQMIEVEVNRVTAGIDIPIDLAPSAYLPQIGARSEATK